MRQVAELKEAADRVRELGEEISVLRAEIKELKEQAEAKENVIARQRSEMIQQQSQAAEALAAANRRFGEEKLELEKSLREMQHNLSSEAEKFARIQQTQADEHNSNIEALADAHRMDVSKLKQQQKLRLSAMSERHRKEISEQSKEIMELSHKLELEIQSAELLSNDLGSAQTIIEKLRSQKSKLRDQLADVRRESEEQKKVMGDQLRTQKKLLQLRITELSNQLLKRTAEANQSAAASAERIAVLEAANSQLHAQISELQLDRQKKRGFGQRGCV